MGINHLVPLLKLVGRVPLKYCRSSIRSPNTSSLPVFNDPIKKKIHVCNFPFYMDKRNSRTNTVLMDSSNIREGNPHYGYRMRLYCRTGYHLTILPNGKIFGYNDDSNEVAKYQILEFTSADMGEVRIRGVYSNLYLSINEDGMLYGEVSENPREEATVFIESFYQQYNTYLSKKYAEREWYVGIKKSGKPKPAHRTGHGQKAIQFLPIRVE